MGTARLERMNLILFRDILIALEAAKNAATLVTENARDFLRWQKLLRPTGRDLRLFDLRKASGI
jgi:predicted nucleic acid-binding protein